mgnify:CR=1 FL=1
MYLWMDGYMYSYVYGYIRIVYTGDIRIYVYICVDMYICVVLCIYTSGHYNDRTCLVMISTSNILPYYFLNSVHFPWINSFSLMYVNIIKCTPSKIYCFIVNDMSISIVYFVMMNINQAPHYVHAYFSVQHFS